MWISYDHQKIQGNGTGTGVIPKGQIFIDSSQLQLKNLLCFTYYHISKLNKSDL